MSSVPEKGDESRENAEYNPKLDFFSEQFDPLLALRTPNVKPPVPSAKTFDNIFMYKSSTEVKPKHESGKSKQQQHGKSVPEAPVERRWLPHQLPVKSTKSKPRRNLFTRMDSTQGPLKLLGECRDKRVRVKIWTRHSHDVRGYCLGYVVAYDKHWNLALEDVEEVWTRPKRRKIPALDSAKYSSEVKPKVFPPRVIVISSTKKTETCTRHVDQLLMRGEQVALIALIPDKQNEDQP